MSSQRGDVPKAIAQLLTELLQRDPGRRPQSASVVYERLEQLRPSVTTCSAGAREPDTERVSRAAPTRTLTRETPDNEDAFEITWTGQDPISSYATYSRRSLRRHWLLFSVLAWPFLHAWLVFVLLANSNDPHDMQLSDVPVAVFVGSVLYPILLHLLYGRHLGAATLNWGRHRRALKDRRPWSLRVDAAGITTTDPRHATPATGRAGHRVYPWGLASTVSLEHAAEFRWGPSYTVLHIQPAGMGPQLSPIRPAGVVHPRSPQGTAGRWPLCALGPMTEQQHQALISALARHAGSRWKPELSR